MIAGNLTAYKGFLETKALALAGVTKFIYGSAAKIANMSRSNTKFGYPLIHVCRPVVASRDNGMGNITTVFYSEIACIGKLNKAGSAEDVENDEMEVEDLTLSVLLEFERQLRLAHRKGDIEFDADVEIEPTLEKWIDAHTGWKMSCKIVLGANSGLCR